MHSNSSTALVLVDPFHDFLADDGAVWPRVRDTALSVGTREHLTQLVTAFRSAGRVVVYAPHRRWRPGDVEGWLRPSPGAAHLRDHGLFADGSIGGQWWAPVQPAPGEIVATEHWGLSGFAHTDLDQQLRQHGVENIVLAGLTAPGCVEGTGRWAAELGYSVTLVHDATAAFDDSYLHAATRLTGPLYASAITSTADVVAATRPRPDSV